jgi:hypothetical protein
MAYQPPVIFHRGRGRPPLRPFVMVGIVYVTLAACYSLGYGQAMSLMAYASDDANRLLARQDYSRITGMGGPLAPLIRLGVLDAIRFEERSLLFGIFAGLWTSTNEMQLAQQNAAIVHPEPPNTGLSQDEVRQMARRALEGRPADPGAAIKPGAVSKEELMRRAKAYAKETGQTLPDPNTLSKEEIRKKLKDFGITVSP